MTDERPEIVEPGTVIRYPSGQTLTVTDLSAVGKDGVLYQTTAWAKRTALYRTAWDSRPLWRKWLGLPPKGYSVTVEPAPLFGFLSAFFGGVRS